MSTYKIKELDILPQRSVADISHIAAALSFGCDVIASWNFKHLVNEKTVDGIRTVAVEGGYKPVGISTSAAIKMLGAGFHGAIGEPEGVVYRYETEERGWWFSGKYVSNPLVGGQDLLNANIQNGVMNHWVGGTYL